MKLVNRIRRGGRVFLDTAPIIYFVEGHPRYAPVVEPVFALLDHGEVVAVTSPITLAETLVIPLRTHSAGLVEAFSEAILRGANTEFVPIGDACAELAARIRSERSLALADAMQLAVAIGAGCKTFLTNDKALKGIPGIEVLVVDEFLP